MCPAAVASSLETILLSLVYWIPYLHLLVRSIMELIKSFTFVGIPNLFDMLIAVI